MERWILLIMELIVIISIFVVIFILIAMAGGNKTREKYDDLLEKHIKVWKPYYKQQGEQVFLEMIIKNPKWDDPATRLHILGQFYGELSKELQKNRHKHSNVEFSAKIKALLSIMKGLAEEKKDLT